MADQTGKFEDAALKAAVRSAWAGVAAPEALRRQISQIALEARPQPRPMRIGWRSLAAAAVLVLGMSSIAFQIVRLRARPAAPPHHYTMQASLVHDLAGRHDASAAASVSHAGSIAVEDLPKIAEQLKQTVHIPVLAASPGADFQLKDARIVEVGNHMPAAELLFKRGNDYLSVFSMPASAVNETKDGSRYDGFDSSHMMSGFVQEGGFYCVAASSPTDFNPTACDGLLSGALQELRKSLPPAGCAVPAKK